MKVVQHPAMAVDMQVSEASAMLSVLRSLAENVEDDEWLARRHDIVSMFYCLADKLNATDKPLSRLTRREACR